MLVLAISATLALGLIGARPAPSRAQSVDFTKTKEHHVGVLQLGFINHLDQLVLCEFNPVDRMLATVDLEVDLAHGNVEGTISGSAAAMPPPALATLDTGTQQQYYSPFPPSNGITCGAYLPAGNPTSSQYPACGDTSVASPCVTSFHSTLGASSGSSFVCCRYSLTYTQHWSIQGTVSGTFDPTSADALDNLQLNGQLSVNVGALVTACTSIATYSVLAGANVPAGSCSTGPMVGPGATVGIAMTGTYNTGGPPPDASTPSPRSSIVGGSILLTGSKTYAGPPAGAGQWDTESDGPASYIPGEIQWEDYRAGQ